MRCGLAKRNMIETRLPLYSCCLYSPGQNSRKKFTTFLAKKFNPRRFNKGGNDFVHKAFGFIEAWCVVRISSKISFPLFERAKHALDSSLTLP